MTTHDLKCWREPFQAIVDGRKKFELRKNDRHFQVGDKLALREWMQDKQQYTGREVLADVVYILHGDGDGRDSFGLTGGLVIMSIAVEAACPYVTLPNDGSVQEC